MTYTYAGLGVVFIGLSISRFLHMDALGIFVFYAGLLLWVVGLVKNSRLRKGVK